MNEAHNGDSGKPDRKSIISSCGLEVRGKEESASLPPPNKAVLAATGGNVRPAATIAMNDSRALDRLDDAWQRYAPELIHWPERDFLLILAGPGSLSEGWFRVHDPVGAKLPSRISAATGHPDALMLSLDGRQFCAITTEDDEYWLITHTFSR
ncbi:hypothetical protein [Streptomyces sp. NPDC059063]|uniref:hypothetical protein n=1 Tax=unclassified Streptomyces TaxID=2593676 RepID=UPI0036B35653